jgi:hypothetical protein
MLLVVGCSERNPVAPDAMDQGVGGGTTSATASPDQEQGGRLMAVALTGAEEAPGPGDPDGSGTARFTFNAGQQEVCFTLTAAGIAAATAAHIHIAPPGQPGPVVVPLTPPTSGSSTGCVAADRDLITEILRNPEAYYVNVHNAQFPAGAVRGQLSK